MESLTQQLDKFLDEDISIAVSRAFTAFDKACETTSGIVLYGAGSIGKKTLEVLKRHNILPLCFTDEYKNKTIKYIDGVPVLSPEDAALRYGDTALFVVTVFNREFTSDYKLIQEKLLSIGIKNIVSYNIIAWKFHDELLPHFAQGVPANILQHKDQIRDAFSILSDEHSRMIFLEFLSISLNPDYARFTPPSPQPAYFTKDVISKLPEAPITFADCGAYDGDTLLLFLSNIGADRLKEYFAFEPDPNNLIKLKSNIDKLPSDIKNKVKCIPFAISEKSGSICFSADGTESAKISDNGIHLQSVSLDDFFATSSVDFIKMDIEGYEKEAIRGATKVINRDNPLLSISIYHCPNDFFEIPLLIRKIRSVQNESNNTIQNRSFFIYRYMSYFYETVLYY